jgi:hypothetical protein
MDTQDQLTTLSVTIDQGPQKSTAPLILLSEVWIQANGLNTGWGSAKRVSLFKGP